MPRVREREVSPGIRGPKNGGLSWYTRCFFPPSPYLLSKFWPSTRPFSRGVTVIHRQGQGSFGPRIDMRVSLSSRQRPPKLEYWPTRLLPACLLTCVPFSSVSFCLSVCRQMGAIGSRTGKSGVSSTGENIPQENFDIPVSGKGRREGLKTRRQWSSPFAPVPCFQEISSLADVKMVLQMVSVCLLVLIWSVLLVGCRAG